ncbi:MAG TPA: gamma-glutamyltransferase [Actinocrinis sp.]|jgi:gamma-glutamyltranspeptidase/glutathione hydrolase|uniref:gamma-glutamyltransferase family protein n=1 Tax=Actinocrinis sp. TaxID=1920516 RepID=UPI002DDCFE41|nr:gamma-glutamyltransferase [Actinocrinis sp.]HEV3169008.1 gamma-glutamyltransferase [Actinocrinis sp.]
MALPLPFTTRPELAGTFGMVASTHYLATAAGMSVLERGGNAFDAAAAAAFTLHVVEPHLNGPGGEVPAIFATAADPVPRVLCGMGTAPAAATLERFSSLGLDLIPGTGLLPATVPGAVGAWLTLLRDHGTLPLRDILDYALGYAERGHPLIPAVAGTISTVAGHFRVHWPTSARQWLPGGEPPVPGQLFALPRLAATYSRLLAEAEAAGSDRETQLDAAIRAWYGGFVAEAIDAFCRNSVLDESGRAHAGLLTGDDLAGWNPSYERTVSLDWHGLTVHKAGPWTQGPVLLQQLGMLEALGELPPPGSAARIHRVTEVAKLAFADREAWYGDDPGVPLADLLDPGYLSARAALAGDTASAELRPGSPGGRVPRLAEFLYSSRSIASGGGALDAMAAVEGAAAGPEPAAPGEAQVSASGATRGDTCHIDVADRWGNMISATPSGGWLQSSPAIPGLGFCLGTRAQMFWLEAGLPATLTPGRRPRITLSPSLATRDGKPVWAFGTPGGDQQDQWQLLLLLGHIADGLGMQAAIDAPAWHSNAVPSSFAPRRREPRGLVLEDRFSAHTIGELRKLGHDVLMSGPWSLGRLSGVYRDPDTGILHAAANPRGSQGYAAGR